MSQMVKGTKEHNSAKAPAHTLDSVRYAGKNQLDLCANSPCVTRQSTTRTTQATSLRRVDTSNPLVLILPTERASRANYTSPVVSSIPRTMFMFCTAAPEAPLPRLSKSAVTVVCSSLPHTTTRSSLVPASPLA